MTIFQKVPKWLNIRMVCGWVNVFRIYSLKFAKRKEQINKMNEIKQKKGLEKRHYKIDADSECIEVHYKSLKENLKYKIPFVEVGNEIIYEADNLFLGKIFLLITCSLTILSIGAYFMIDIEKPEILIVNALLFGTLSFLNILKTSKDDILIVNGSRVIRLFRDKPNEENVLEFANNAIKIANNKKKELLINYELSEDRFQENIQWLLSTNLIHRSESEELISQYKLKKLI